MIKKDAVLALIVFGVLVVALVLFWEHQILLSAGLFGLFIIGRIVWPRRRYDWTLYLTTVVLSLVVELVCVHYGAWTYTKPNLINIPSYIPFAYGVGVLALVKLVGVYCEVDVGEKVHPKDMAILFTLLLVLAGAMSLLWRSNLLLTSAAVLLSLAVYLLSSSDYDYTFYAVSFLLVPIIDITNIAQGVWVYGSDPILWSIPLWLPFAYAVGLLLVVKIGLSTHRLVPLLRQKT
jgi:hypothetical protein